MAKKKNTSRSLLTQRQSGDDWGMDTTYEDWMNEPDPMLGMTDEEIQNFDWEAWAASQTNDPIPGEVDSSGFSPDFTDSGIQSGTRLVISACQSISNILPIQFVIHVTNFSKPFSTVSTRLNFLIGSVHFQRPSNHPTTSSQTTYI